MIIKNVAVSLEDMKYIKLLCAVISVALLLSLSNCSKQETVEKTKPYTSEEKLKEKLILKNDFLLELWNNFLIFKRHEKLFYKESIDPNDIVSIFLVEPPLQTRNLSDSSNKSTSINSDNPLGLVLEYQKPNETFEYCVFLVGKAIKKVAVISNGYSRWQIKTSEGGERRILANDWYTDWGAKTVAPEIIFKWNGNNFIIDTNSMKNRSRSRKELYPLESAIREQFSQFPESADIGPIGLAPPELASEIFDLYYCGQSIQAKNFYDHCWPVRMQGKTAYWSFLMKEMKQSPYWSAIRTLNTLPKK